MSADRPALHAAIRFGPATATPAAAVKGLDEYEHARPAVVFTPVKLREHLGLEWSIHHVCLENR